MAKKRVTVESLRLRLMDLFPEVHTSVSLNVWSHGNVHVSLSAHPSRGCCWSIFSVTYSDDRPLEARKQEALVKALAQLEAGQWQKTEVVPEAAAVHHAG